MSLIPIQFNVFRQVEHFFLLQRLDKQYSEMVAKYDLEKESSRDLQTKAQDGQISLNWPTWEFEKKVLLWTYLNHKHLGSPLTLEKIKEKDFLIDVHSADLGMKTIRAQHEIIACGSKYVLENLAVRGFANWAENATGIRINEKGLTIGMVLSKNYSWRVGRMLSKDSADSFEYYRLVPKKYKLSGHWLILFSGFAIILWSITFLCFQVIEIVGLLDEIKNHLSFLKGFQYFPYFLLLPTIFFSLGLILLATPFKNKSIQIAE